MKLGFSALILGGLFSLGALAQEGYGTPPSPGGLPAPEANLPRGEGQPTTQPSAQRSMGERPNRSSMSLPQNRRTRNTPAGSNPAQSGGSGSTGALSSDATSIAPSHTSVQEAQALGEMLPRRAYKAFWSMQLGGQFTRDTLANQRTQSALGLNLGLDYEFTPIFFLSVNPRFAFKNGHVQAATSSNGRESNMELVNAAAILSDRNYYLVSAGALDMTAVHSALLVGATFPAAKIQISTGEKNPFSLSVIGLAAVPSSATLTSNSQDYDRTPSFNSASIRATYNTRNLDILAQLGQFEYKEIPLNVSTDSVLLGNTALQSTNTPQTDFRYAYQGLESRLNMAFGMTRALKYKFQSSYIRNGAAPAGYNQGFVSSHELEYIHSGQWRFAPSFTYFHVQPDTTVANYNDAMISTNRVGYAGGLMIQYKRLFKAGGLFGEREVVFEKTSQARERFVTLTLETFDAPF